MKTSIEIKLRINNANKTGGLFGAVRGRTIRNTALFGVVVGSVLITVHTAAAEESFNKLHQVGDVFVFALENHNLTQPNPTSSTQQILGNPAAPYINSLITPGNSNAAQVAYSAAYYNAGIGVHPSEPNYVWAEAGSDFGFHSDADPNPTNGNTFYDTSGPLLSEVEANGSTIAFWHRNHTQHLTGQLDEAGILWKNYQEDIELSASPTNSATGTNGPVNPYNKSTQYSYAVKHNPMAFFSDTDTRNVYPLAQFFTDLNNDAVGQYNWITPDQYNEAHSSLTGGFEYQGVHYSSDQAAIAECDNFLSVVIPQVMASKAYKNNGVIILWWDETEGGDDTNHTLGEIVISPLAKGNAYASPVVVNHSSDIKTMEEIFHLPFVNNPIPASETEVSGAGYNNVATVNDLSDLFLPGVIPSTGFSVTYGPFINGYQGRLTQRVTIMNNGDAPVSTPIFLALDNFGTNATLVNSAGVTQVLAPLGSPYVSVPVDSSHDNEKQILEPHQFTTATLEFADPSGEAITYNGRVLNVIPAP
jgi:hypothetical protein